MTTTTELADYANRIIAEFHGVYAIDTLPTSDNLQNALFIINTDSSNLPGTHWIAVIARNNIAYCFDPLGYPPPSTLSYWLSRHYLQWSCNTRQIQPVLSNRCGYFCLHFLYYATTDIFKDIQLNKITNMLYPLSMSPYMYESIIIEFVKSVLEHK